MFISAEFPYGIPPETVRIVRENFGSLKFRDIGY